MQTRFNRQNYKNLKAEGLERLREGQARTIYDRNRLENLSKREEYEENAAQNEMESEQNNQPQNYQNAQYDNDISKQRTLQTNLLKNLAQKKALQSAGKIAAKQAGTKAAGHGLAYAATAVVGSVSCGTIIFYGLVIGVIVAVLVILYNAGNYLGLF